MTDRTIADRYEELRQGYLGTPRRVLEEEHEDKLQGVTQNALGHLIVKNTPKQLELEALRQKYPGMTNGVPLEQLQEVWKSLSNMRNQTAVDTDAKPWDPREHPDTGLAYRPKSLERELEERGLPLNMGYAPRGTDPRQPGITNTYQVSPQAKALGNVIAALNDPRNAWMGMGMLRGMRLLQPIPKGPEMGGFRETTRQMRKALDIPRPNLPKMEVPSVEQAIRNDYLGEIGSVNNMARTLLKNPQAQVLEDSIALPEGAESAIKDIPNLEQVILNLNKLEHYTKIRPHTTYAREGPVPPYLMKKFGFK